MLCQASRVQPGAEERFVRVDVADAGHDTLIEQHGLQTPRRLGELLAPVVPVESERLGPESCRRERCIERGATGVERGAAEAADVAKTQFGAVVESEDKMRMVVARGGTRDDGELSRHAEM